MRENRPSWRSAALREEFVITREYVNRDVKGPGTARNEGRLMVAHHDHEGVATNPREIALDDVKLVADRIAVLSRVARFQSAHVAKPAALLQVPREPLLDDLCCGFLDDRVRCA